MVGVCDPQYTIATRTLWQFCVIDDWAMATGSSHYCNPGKGRDVQYCICYGDGDNSNSRMQWTISWLTKINTKYHIHVHRTFTCNVNSLNSPDGQEAANVSVRIIGKKQTKGKRLLDQWKQRFPCTVSSVVYPPQLLRHLSGFVFIQAWAKYATHTAPGKPLAPNAIPQGEKVAVRGRERDSLVQLHMYAVHLHRYQRPPWVFCDFEAMCTTLQQLNMDRFESCRQRPLVPQIVFKLFRLACHNTTYTVYGPKVTIADHNGRFPYKNFVLRL